MLSGRNGRLRWRLPHLARNKTWTETLPLVRPRAARAAAKTDEADPVFLDSTGRRARIIRRLAYAVVALLAGYTVVLVLSLMGATPFAPSSVLPVPGVPSDEPGTVRRTTRPDLPGASVSPALPSVSPTDLPAPTTSPTASPTASSPGDEPTGTAPPSGSGDGTPTAPTGDPGTSEPPATSPGETTEPPGTSPGGPTTSPSTGSAETTAPPSSSSAELTTASAETPTTASGEAPDVRPSTSTRFL